MPRHPVPTRGGRHGSSSRPRSHHVEHGRYEEGIDDFRDYQHSYHGVGERGSSIPIPYLGFDFGRRSPIEHQNSPTTPQDSPVTPQDSTAGPRHSSVGPQVSPAGPQVSHVAGSNSTPPIHRSSSRRPHIDLTGEKLDVSVGRQIILNLKAMFRGPWSRWKDVDAASRKAMWDRFRHMYQWNDEDEELIQKLWVKVLKDRFPDIMCEARMVSEKMARKANVVGQPDDISHLVQFNPPWITAENWERMINETWNTPEWKAKSKAAQKNRNTIIEGGSTARHTGGSISLAEHRIRMVI